MLLLQQSPHGLRLQANDKKNNISVQGENFTLSSLHFLKYFLLFPTIPYAFDARLNAQPESIYRVCLVEM
jgi:hypothetical protein